MRAEPPLKVKTETEEKKELLKTSGASTGVAALFVAGRWCDEPGVLCVMKIRPVGRGVRTPGRMYCLPVGTSKSSFSKRLCLERSYRNALSQA